MGVIFAFVLTFLGAVVVSAAGQIVADEAKASMPHLAQWVLRGAIRALPQRLRERYAEEWAADLGDIPGPISKVTWALGFFVAAVWWSAGDRASDLARAFAHPRQDRAEIRAITAGIAAFLSHLHDVGFVHVPLPPLEVVAARVDACVRWRHILQRRALLLRCVVRGSPPDQVAEFDARLAAAVWHEAGLAFPTGKPARQLARLVQDEVARRGGDA